MAEAEREDFKTEEEKWSRMEISRRPPHQNPGSIVTLNNPIHVDVFVLTTKIS